MQLSSERRTLLNQIGQVILVAGLCLGGLVYRSAPSNPVGVSSASVDEDSSLSPEDTRRYGHATEVNFGKVGMLVDKGMHAAANLDEPRPLGVTIIIVSILASVGCFALAAQEGTAGDDPEAGS